MDADLDSAADASPHVPDVLAEPADRRRRPAGLSPLQSRAASGRGPAGVGMPPPPAAGTRRTRSRGALRGPSDSGGGRQLHLGAQHPAGWSPLSRRVVELVGGTPPACSLMVR